MTTKFLVACALLLLISPVTARDDGRYAGSPLFETKNSFKWPSAMESIVKRPLWDAELLSPVVQILLGPSKHDLDAAASIVGLLARREPVAIGRTIIPVVILPLDRKTALVGRSHVLIKVHKSEPALADLDTSSTVPMIGFVARIGAAGDHGKPYSDDRMPIPSRKSEQSTSNETSGHGISHFLVPVRDDGKYADSPLRSWFDSLKSGKGPCCSDADGTALSDVDWETKDGHYRVRLEDKWWDVPDEAVITEPNRAQRTMVWPIYFREMDKAMRIEIRCFMPGSMT